MSPIDETDADQPSGGWREGFSRRTFLRRGTLAAAAVGVVGSVPGLSGLLLGGAAEAPAAESAATEAEGDVGPMTEPLLAHVKDLGTGEISLFQGERETVIRSPALARQLLSAVRR
jgi:hypothetical protein